MDDLTMRFAEESLIRSIKDCSDVESLQDIACNLVVAHYSAKKMLGRLLLESIEQQVEKELPA